MLVKLKELIVSYHTTADQTHCHDNDSSKDSDAKADQDLLSQRHVLEDGRSKDESVGDDTSGNESKNGCNAATESSAALDEGLGTTVYEKEETAAASVVGADSVHLYSSSESSDEHRENSKNSIDPVENTSKEGVSASEEDLKITDKLAENNESRITTPNHADEERKPKGIIFTQTRELTKVLEEWVTEDQDLLSLGIKPLRLLGSGDGRSMSILLLA